MRGRNQVDATERVHSRPAHFASVVVQRRWPLEFDATGTRPPAHVHWGTSIGGTARVNGGGGTLAVGRFCGALDSHLARKTVD